MNTTSKYPDLVSKLKEIFQIDKPDLDFGVYRILNARRAEIEDYLDNRFKARVEAALSGGAADAASAATAGEDAESLVYSHLLAFFSRYYEDGDFISQRRYKDGVYAIPYSGEEVKLHWANADQYYTKTGENFSNYGFTLPGGRKVHFALVAADTAKDNVKDADAARLFALWEPQGQSGEEPEDSGAESPEGAPADGDAPPQRPSDFLEVKDGELFIYFQYRKFPKKTKQGDLAKAARDKILPRVAMMPDFSGLAAEAPTEKEPHRTLLEKHLADYTAKNTSDYFIHKDLGAFLRRELDFYVKNEMMRLDEVDLDGAAERIAAQLSTIRVFRAVALDLIAFMAQLEDFQKKLWLKKKFVVRSDWCFTLDIVAEHAPELLDEIFASDAQKAEWRRLGLPDEDFRAEAHPVGADRRAARDAQGELNFGDAASPRRGERLDARMVDTKFFPPQFKAKLLAAIPDLDERRDGLLVRSENFQALRLLQPRFKGQVKCIYIDPPYNTGSDGFLYKDGYSHSSWLSLMAGVLPISKQFMSNDSIQAISLDDGEFHRLNLLCESGNYFKLGEVVVHRKRGRDNSARDFSKTHDSLLFLGASDEARIRKESLGQETVSAYRNRDNDPRGPHRDLALWARGTQGGCRYAFTMSDGYRFSERLWLVAEETMKQLDSDNRLIRINDNLYRKLFLSEHEGQVPETIWTDVSNNANAADEIKGLFGTITFGSPKPLPLVKKCLSISGPNDALILDYFAGSGTTGHAVIDLNRQDQGHRKYILVEMGEHFETVLKPRIEKVIFSPDWKDGKPESADKGVSHCFQYLALESYEDALNNLELKKPDGAAPDLLGSDAYLLKYMLDVEARGSVLSTDDFRHPFDYALKIAVDSSGASERRNVDLVETFNYLAGLRVAHVDDRRKDRGLVLVEGTLPGGETALVVWRDVGKVDSEALSETLQKLGYLSKTDEKPLKGVDAIYVNGDHALPAVISGETGQTKVRAIEDAFLSAMFGEEP